MLPPSPVPSTDAPHYRHRGFDLRLCVGVGGQFGFGVSHVGLALHASEAAYSSPASAERAARRFVDDALGAYDAASRALAA